MAQFNSINGTFQRTRAHIVKVRKSWVALFICFSIFSTGFAQTPPASGAAPQEEKTKSPNGPRKQLATIIFAGLGGAVLGLSTLSFYGRPQDKLSNIAVGFAFGVITGTAIVTYRAATNPAEFYGSQYRPDESYQQAVHFAQSSDVIPLKLSYWFEF